MKKFEYRVISVDLGTATSDTLNEMGNKGWEAIDFYRATSSRTPYTMITFKREKR